MYLLVHANIRVVEGAKRSVICDLQNEEMYLIPGSLASFITSFNKKSQEEIYEAFAENEREIISEYLKWMEEKDMIVWVKEKDTLEFFPEMSEEWDSPFKISNIIVDTFKDNNNWNQCVAEINSLSIPFLELRFFNVVTADEADTFLQPTRAGTLKGIELVIPYDKSFTDAGIKLLLKNNIRISKIVFYNSLRSESYTDMQNDYPVTIIHTENTDINEKHCGVIESYQFRSNNSLFTESIHHNTCLNRKIAVDIYGNIKNCPSMKESYGNIVNTSFREVLNKEGFKKLWNLSKDKISICKVCEFRQVCTDCRAYIQDPEDMYSKPLKCGYDPYTNKWEEWSTNALSKKGILHYNLVDTFKYSLV